MKTPHYLADRAEDDSPIPLAQLLAQDEGALWVDMNGPTEDDLRALREVFTFHSLAIEDVITAVFASLAVISGIYGMNVQRAYPPFDWPSGFAAVLQGMGGITAVMLALFRRQGWL